MAIKTVSRQRLSVGSAVSGSSYGTTIPITNTVISASTNTTITAVYITDSSYNVLDDTAVNASGGYIKLIGTNFASGCTVYTNGVAAALTTFVSSTEVRVQLTGGTPGATASLMLFNNPSQGAIWGSGILFSGFPSVSNPSITNQGTAVNVQLVGVGDAPLTYTLKSGSTLPDGVTLSSTGLLSGNSTVTSNTVFTFSILVNDPQLQTTQVDITLTVIYIDSLFNLTTLSLTETGNNNFSNTGTFTNSAWTPFNFVAIGSPANSSFSPWITSSWSGYFNGSTDYLSIASTSSLALSSNDFTVELWYYLTVNSLPNTTIIDWRNGTSGAGVIQPLLEFQPTGNLGLNWYVGAGNRISSGLAAVRYNTWQHATVCRSSGITRMFVDGIQVGSNYTDTNNYPAGSVIIGRSNDGAANRWFPGYISNLRILNGTALYTATFTTSTINLVTTTNTNLLTLQTYRIYDSSTASNAITPVGSVAATPFGPFTSTAAYSTATDGSMYFGPGDYLREVTTQVPALGTGALTVEMWLYCTTTTNTTYTLLNQGDGNNGGSFRMYFNPSSAGGVITINNGTANVASASLTSLGLLAFQWHHIALVRDVTGNNMSIFVDGIRRTAQSGGSISAAFSSQNGSYIGQYNNTVGGGTNTTNFPGYITSLRYIPQVAVYDYTATSIPVPVGPLPTTQAQGSYLSAISGTSTKILLKGNEYNIYDTTTRNPVVTANNSRVSTAVVQYGSGSMYFDGTTDRLIIPPNNLNAFFTGDFTIEFWINLVALSTNVRVISQGTYTTGEFFFRINTDGSANFTEAASTVITFPAGSFATGGWRHVAICRSSGTIRGFLNGSSVVSAASTYNYNAVTALYIGSNPSTASEDLNGYMDDIRITRSARYVATFGTPSGKFLTR